MQGLYKLRETCHPTVRGDLTGRQLQTNEPTIVFSEEEKSKGQPQGRMRQQVLQFQAGKTLPLYLYESGPHQEPSFYSSPDFSRWSTSPSSSSTTKLLQKTFSLDIPFSNIWLSTQRPCYSRSPIFSTVSTGPLSLSPQRYTRW